MEKGALAKGKQILNDQANALDFKFEFLPSDERLLRSASLKSTSTTNF